MATAYVFASADHSHMIPYLAALHGSCILHDAMVGTFLPPLNNDKLLAWWKERIAEVNTGTRMILLLLEESEPGSRAKGPELKGVIMLGMPPVETSPHCGSVELLLIKPEYRRRGGAKTLISAVEMEALHRGKTLLRMETEAGSRAEDVFRRYGYQEVGKIPGYSVNNKGESKDEAIYYKSLTAA